MSDPTCVMCFERVSFAYGQTPVLTDVQLHVEAGQLAAIVGPNGGGKTTLLKLALGLLAPTSGHVRMFGQPPERARNRIGYMPQYAHVDPRFPVTVLDVVLMGMLNHRGVAMRSRAEKEAANRALAEVDMEALADRPFDALSGGQRQRVLLARALVSEPEMLLLDEPTANVDNEAEDKLNSILRRLNQRMTILLVSHDLGFVSQVVQSVICVNRHVVVHPTSELTGDMVRGYYGNDLRMVRHDHRCNIPGHDHKEGDES